MTRFHIPSDSDRMQTPHRQLHAAPRPPLHRSRTRRVVSLGVSLALLFAAGAALTPDAADAAKKTTKKRRYRAPASGSQAALVMDAQTGDILYEKNGGQARSIASLTKLMTAMVYLETEPDLEAKMKVEKIDLAGSGKTQLRRGEIVRVHDLLYHSLMSSDNAATKTLVRVSGLTEKEFLARMNRKAAVLGLNATKFTEFTGLDAGNVSSAYDLANLLRFALEYPEIGRITSEPDYAYRSSRRHHQLVNSNRLARYGTKDVRGGKTGYIRAAGYCLATCVRESGRELITVVLGSPSNPARFNETNIVLGKVTKELSNFDRVEDLEVVPGG